MKTVANREVRDAIKHSGAYQYEIAYAIGISEAISDETAAQILRDFTGDMEIMQRFRSVLEKQIAPSGRQIADQRGNTTFPQTLAIYHWNIGIVSRGKGKSAVAAAAYRSGEKLTNEWDGMTHDYTRKGGVVHTEIMLPPHAPPSFSDRSTLWNSVELYEKAGNAQLAREIDAALPIELSREEQIRLVREYCSSQFVSRGMCVDYAIHDTDSGNPHCHIMLTMRPLDERGAWAAKSKKEYDLDENGERIRLPSGRYKTHKIDLTGWNDKDNTLLWRKAWADYTNDFLERNGSPERIDHRSNAERGIDEIPTVHMGVAACQMEKKRSGQKPGHQAVYG